MLKIRRSNNFHPLEVQALLKACLTYKVEEFRQAGKSTGHLFYDIQQEMAKYGDFPDRPLMHLRAHYRRVQRRYKEGHKPYPPEARELWGRLAGEIDVSENDAAWNVLTEKKNVMKASGVHVTKPELAELIKETIEKNVEALSEVQRKEAFQVILNNIQRKKLFLGRNADYLQRTYNRLRNRYLKGKYNSEFPESAAKLWSRMKDNVLEFGDDIPAVDSPGPWVHDSPDLSKVMRDAKDEAINPEIVCSICQSCAYEAKHLFRDVYQNQTYAEIINQTLNVKLLWNGHSSALICLLCSTYVESLPVFWNQCLESYDKLNDELVTKEEPMLGESSCWESNQGTGSPSHDVGEATSLGSEHFRADDTFGESSLDEVVASEIPKPTVDDVSEERQPIERSKALKKARPVKKLTREELNMIKFKESFPPSAHRRSKNVPKQCDLCGKTVLDLKSHLNSHYKNKCYACDFCPRRFTSRHQLRTHRNTHTRERQYPCSYCDAVYTSWKGKNYHEKRHVEEMNNASYSCDQCGATYKVEKNLLEHIKFKHLQLRKFQCSQCAFATINKVRLVNHVRSIHSQERPYQCPYCSFNANSNTGYFIHFKRHKTSGLANEYSMKCGYCEEMFQKDSIFEKHILQEHPDRAIKV